MTDVEAALQAWVLGASGLATGKVYWAQQTNAPRPAAPCIALRLTDDRQVGHDWVDVDDNGDDTFTYAARGVRTATLTLQCFAVDATGVSTAVALLKKVRDKARLSTYADALDAADVSIGSFEAIQSIDGIVNAVVFEPRAVMAVSLHLTSEESEAGNIIEHVEITGEVD